VGIVGGKLQGIEAAYLARKAGWEIKLVDRNDRVPACHLGDTFVQANVTDEGSLDGVLDDVDFIIPALENESALSCLTRWCRKRDVPLAFDSRAHAVSSSKLKSAELFRKIGVPVPDAWPRCEFPVLAKPGRGSGSKGVHVYHDLESLKTRFPNQCPPPGWIVEKYIGGSQHSLEVIGRPGNYRVLQVTDLFVDQNFDCKRVIAPSTLAPDLIGDFEKLALTIAEGLNLRGIMDVEVIYSDGEFKILEIDARLPSQTPTAVYWSTDQNMVELLGELYAENPDSQPPAEDFKRGVVYEHIRVSGDILEVRGEGIMTQGGPLKYHRDFFGADEAISNYMPGKDDWSATLICSATSREQAGEKQKRSITEIVRYLGIQQIIDREPDVVF
jgi:pyrrolysine biosynthesis protein PylC